MIIVPFSIISLDGDVHRHRYIQDLLTSIGKVKETSKLSLFCCQTVGCSHIFDTLELYEHHYNTMHRNACTSCKHFFPTTRLLDIHIFECHDSIFQIKAEKGNMYQCLVEGCMENFKTDMERKTHLIKMHFYPSDLCFDRTKNVKSENKQKPIPRKDATMAIVTGEESMDICAVQFDEKSSNSVMPQKITSTCLHTKYRIPSTICFGHGTVRGFSFEK
ncbi:zinc finger protein 511-like isoform X2 [Xenopus laevis]|uniref:Zinc finger protein 511-like isoform X2 n=1 Tax=Xenopus laevis TaxID=8355 RepID=A0A8J0T1G8_XENLA|nr:zinc finger protein 511-like isoform X2 [Xenopus laevis]